MLDVRKLTAGMLAAAMLTGCGGSGGAEEGAKDNAVRLTADDGMNFSTRTLSATVGKEFEITFANVGKMPKEQMGHNLIILKPTRDAKEFGMAAAQAKDTDYVPKDLESWIVAKTKLLGPGEEEVLKVTFEKPGRYPFLCTFPGHFSTMRGTIRVK